MTTMKVFGLTNKELIKSEWFIKKINVQFKFIRYKEMIKIKLEPKIGVLSQVIQIPFILGKVGTLNILASLIKRIIIYFFKMGNHFK